MTTTATGTHFESLALAQLERAGLKLVARNYRTRFGELDLVMRDADSVVFVEVRYRHAAGYGGASASIGAAKQARLTRAAQGFLQARPELAGLPCRFDVLAFDGAAAKPTCDWQRGAFEAF